MLMSAEVPVGPATPTLVMQLAPDARHRPRERDTTRYGRSSPPGRVKRSVTPIKTKEEICESNKDTNDKEFYFLYDKVMAGTAIMVRGGISVGHNLLLKDSREWNERRWIQRDFYRMPEGLISF